MKSHKKIYYIPGLISLVFLPLLMLWHLNKEGAFQKYSAIEVYSFYLEPNIDIEEYASYFKDSILKNNYIEIKLTGNEEEDIIKLRSAQLNIRELKQSEEKTKGLCIHFGDSSKYWELVKAIDICNIEEIKTFSLFKNNLWIFNFKKDPTMITEREFPIFECGYNNDSPKVPEISFKEKVLFHLSRFYPLMIIFILMIFGAVITIYNRHFNSNIKHSKK